MDELARQYKFEAVVHFQSNELADKFLKGLIDWNGEPVSQSDDWAFV